MLKGRLFVVVFVFVWLVSAPWAGRAEDPRPPAEADFTGKILAISTTYPDKAGAVLEQVQVRKIGSRTFLVGKGADDGRADNPYKGRTVWISVEHIVQIVQFDNAADLKKAAEAARKE